MKKDNIAIKLINVSKKYTIHHEKPTLVEHLITGKHEEFWAHKTINLSTKKVKKLAFFERLVVKNILKKNSKHYFYFPKSKNKVNTLLLAF